MCRVIFHLFGPIPPRGARPRPLASGEGNKSRESLSQKSLSKRHVFSAIYLLFNSKVPKKAGLVRCLSSPQAGGALRSSDQPQAGPVGLRSTVKANILFTARTGKGQGHGPKAHARAPSLASAATNHLFYSSIIFINIKRWPPTGGSGQREFISRESLSQKSLSKRHVFSAIYLLFNSKVPKKAGLRGQRPQEPGLAFGPV